MRELAIFTLMTCGVMGQRPTSRSVVTEESGYTTVDMGRMHQCYAGVSPSRACNWGVNSFITFLSYV